MEVAMPYSLDWEPHGVVKKFFGFVSGAEFVQSVVDVTGSDKFDDLRFIVNDFLSADGHSIDKQTFEEIVVYRIGAARTRSSIWTAVITNDPRFAAIADEVNAALPDGVPRTEVFATLAVARTWLAQQPQFPVGRTFRIRH